VYFTNTQLKNAEDLIGGGVEPPDSPSGYASAFHRF